MYQFFVELSQIDVEGKRVVIVGSDVNHIKNVLRMKLGEEIAVSNGQDGKEYRCAVTELLEDRVECELRFIKEDGVELPAKIYLFQGLPKGDKMELIIQKTVELGVFEIIPVTMKRCVMKIEDKKAPAKIARWQGIAEAAAKQSKRGIIPQIHGIMSYKEAVKYASDMDVMLVPYECAEGMPKTRALLEAVKPGQSVAVFIGPEGGFDDSEISLATEAGAETITLGRRILRTETAGLVTISWLGYLLEDVQE